MNNSKRSAYTGLRTDILSMITVNPKSVLDVGCSNGIFLEYAKEKLGAEFAVGIEFDSDLIIEAEGKADKLIKADLDVIKIDDFHGLRFDLIVLADVLEHTKEPINVLYEILKAATDDAQIIISLPNIQHWTAIKNLIIGVWPERDRGLFDKAHLRFFTLRSIISLASQCGLKIEAVRRNYRIVDSPSSRINRFARFLGFWPLTPYFSYQYVLRLKKTLSLR